MVKYKQENPTGTLVRRRKEEKDSMRSVRQKYISLILILSMFFLGMCCGSTQADSSLMYGDVYKRQVQNQILNTLFLLQVQSAMLHQMQDAIGFSHRLCSIIFPLYDNRMCGIFQCTQKIFS